VALFLEGAYLAWNSYRGPEASRIERRLNMLVQDQRGPVSKTQPRLLTDTPDVSTWLQWLPRVKDLDRLLQQTGLAWHTNNFAGLTVMLVAATAVSLVLLHVPLLFVLAVAVLVGFGPLWYALRARRKRIERIEAGLPDALDLVGRAMIAGHAFPSALKMVADEMPEPVAGEFRIVFGEINYGIDVGEALTHLTERVPSEDLRYFVISVLIQRETGGNLGELLANISALIRSRLKLLGQVKVLSAEGRMSALILVILPFVLAAVIMALNPEFLSVLWTDPQGMYIVGGGLVAMAVGVMWIRRIVRIHV
jgi:tight adherence protein B